MSAHFSISSSVVEQFECLCLCGADGHSCSPGPDLAASPCCFSRLRLPLRVARQTTARKRGAVQRAGRRGREGCRAEGRRRGWRRWASAHILLLLPACLLHRVHGWVCEHPLPNMCLRCHRVFYLLVGQKMLNLPLSSPPPPFILPSRARRVDGRGSPRGRGRGVRSLYDGLPCTAKRTRIPHGQHHDAIGPRGAQRAAQRWWQTTHRITSAAPSRHERCVTHTSEKRDKTN